MKKEKQNISNFNVVKTTLINVTDYQENCLNKIINESYIVAQKAIRILHKKMNMLKNDKEFIALKQKYGKIKEEMKIYKKNTDEFKNLEAKRKDITDKIKEKYKSIDFPQSEYECTDLIRELVTGNKNKNKYPNAEHRNVNNHALFIFAGQINYINTMVYQKIEKYLYGNSHKISFFKKDDFNFISTNGINKTSGMKIFEENNRWFIEITYKKQSKNNRKKYGNKKRGKPLKLEFNCENEYLYRHLKNSTISTKTIKKVPYHNKFRYELTIGFKNTNIDKLDHNGNIKLNPSTEYEYVGIDSGVKDIHIVGIKKNGEITLESKLLTKPNDDIINQMMIIDQKMEEIRKKLNPDNYNEDGTCKQRNQLKKWVYNDKYFKLKHEKKNLNRIKKERKKNNHYELINYIINKYGININYEKSANQKASKKTKDIEKNEDGSFKKKISAGKSLNQHAPYEFYCKIKYRIEELGGTFKEIDTVKTSTSQYNHIDQTKNKEMAELDIIEKMIGDSLVSRHLYSALLIACIYYDEKSKEDKINNDLVTKYFDKFVVAQTELKQEMLKNKYYTNAFDFYNINKNYENV